METKIVIDGLEGIVCEYNGVLVQIKEGDNIVLCTNREAKELRNFLNQLDLGE